MKKTFLFILTGMLVCLFPSCKESNTPADLGEDTPAANKEFSVSATKKVYFSQGNLQYQASTKTWWFAERQYDYIGIENENISDSYTGLIDLFEWGTGNNPTKTFTSWDDYTTFIDWGVNPISNGGNKANLWRTLTKNEYSYLFVNRPDAARLFAFGKVRGICGIILLPDEWNTPDGVTFIPSTENGLENKGNYYSGHHGDQFSDNTYTAEQWSLMEKAGAVFLPAAGYRHHGKDYQVGYDDELVGNYWSSTEAESGYVYILLFGIERNEAYLEWQYDTKVDDAFSVRLVQDVK